MPKNNAFIVPVYLVLTPEKGHGKFDVESVMESLAEQVSEQLEANLDMSAYDEEEGEFSVEVNSFTGDMVHAVAPSDGEFGIEVAEAAYKAAQ